MTDLIIKSGWNEWQRGPAVPESADAVQIRETRRAFYGGAQCVMTAIVKALEDPEPSKAIKALLIETDDELREFFEAVQAGRY